MKIRLVVTGRSGRLDNMFQRHRVLHLSYPQVPLANNVGLCGETFSEQFRYLRWADVRTRKALPALLIVRFTWQRGVRADVVHGDLSTPTPYPRGVGNGCPKVCMQGQVAQNKNKCVAKSFVERRPFTQEVGGTPQPQCLDFQNHVF